MGQCNNPWVSKCSLSIFYYLCRPQSGPLFLEWLTSLGEHVCRWLPQQLDLISPPGQTKLPYKTRQFDFTIGNVYDYKEYK